MGDANDVMQQYSGRAAYNSSTNDFYNHYVDFDHSRRHTLGNHGLATTSALSTRQNTYRPSQDRSNISKTLTSHAFNVVFDLASGVKSKYVKSPTSTPDLQNDMYVYHKASDESRQDTQNISIPPSSRPPPSIAHTQTPALPPVIKNTASNRFAQQNARFLTYHRHQQSKLITSNEKPSRASIKEYLEQFEAPPSWSRIPPRQVVNVKPSSVAITMDDVMNKLKEEVERYTYLLDDAERTMKDYETDIDDTLNQLQSLENKIKDMNLKTAHYTALQSNISTHLDTINKDNNRVKSARRKQRKLDDMIERWKGKRDPMHQFSFILAAHERMEKLDKYTRTFWDIGFYLLIILFLLAISFLSLL